MTSKLTDAFSISDQIGNLYHHGHKLLRGHSTGWPAMDEYFCVGDSELTVITGLPGHRKSAWLDNLSVNLACSQDWGWVSFTPENISVAYYHRKLISQYLGLPFYEGHEGRMSQDQLADGIRFVQRHFTVIEPDHAGRGLVSILGSVQQAIDIAETKSLRRAARIKGVIIDNWANIEQKKAYNHNEHEYIGKCLVSIIEFCRSRSIHLFMVAHPRKMNVDGKIKAPHPYHISGSSHWFNLVDNAVTVWKEDDYRMKIHLRKVKLMERGKCGDVELFFDTKTGCFYDNEYHKDRPNGAIRLYPEGWELPELPVEPDPVRPIPETDQAIEQGTPGEGTADQEHGVLVGDEPIF